METILRLNISIDKKFCYIVSNDIIINTYEFQDNKYDSQQILKLIDMVNSIGCIDRIKITTDKIIDNNECYNFYYLFVGSMKMYYYLKSIDVVYDNIELRNWYVYIHINKINGKKYIGVTQQEPTKRWKKNGYGYRTQPFYRAIQKYGWDGFKHIILYKNFTESEAKEKEKLLIKLFDTRIDKNGYNLTNGGDGALGLIITDESRKRMRESHLGSVPWNKGKGGYSSKEQSDRMAKLWESSNYRERQRQSHLGNKQTEETKRKISENSAKSKRIIGIKLDGSVFISKSSAQAQRDNYGSSSSISLCCNNHKLLVNGIMWFHLDEYSDDLLEKRIDEIISSGNLYKNYRRFCK